MLMDKLLSAVGETNVSDGMGGYETFKGVLHTIKAIVVDMPVDKTISDERLLATTFKKVITLDEVDSHTNGFIYDNIYYSIESYMKAKNHNIYICKEIGEYSG